MTKQTSQPINDTHSSNN